LIFSTLVFWPCLFLLNFLFKVVTAIFIQDYKLFQMRGKDRDNNVNHSASLNKYFGNLPGFRD
jgi:hypothetical protein